MPPPPWKWHPLQLYCSNSCCPWLTAYALPSYGLSSLAARHGLDNPARVVDQIADDVADGAAVGQRMRGRRVDVIVADHLHAHAPLFEARIVERLDAEVAVAARDEDVRGAVVGLGGPGQLEIAGNADDHVAVAGLQGVAHEAAPLRPPRVLDFLAEVARHKIRDGVLETLSL